MMLPRGPGFGLMAVLLLSACANSGLDWDFRRGGGFDTSEAARRATDNRPQADANGVINYGGSQVVVARRGDTVGSIAQRLGIDAGALASYNALRPSDSLREGETIALPTRVAAAGGVTAAAPVTGGIIGSTTPPATGGGQIDVTTIASSAIDRAAPPPAAAPTKPAAPAAGDPVRHKVQRGETAYTIARAYNVSAKSIADWNGLGPDLAVREGQVLTIPTSSGAAPAPELEVEATPPGKGSPTPTPPSAKKPLPKDEAPAKDKAKETPKSPDLGNQRTGASATKLVMPVSGKIIRSYQKKKNDGIDISAAAGTAVKAADAGTVAAVTKDTNGTPIVVIRHANNLLTVYAGVDSLKVQKGAAVARGQAIAVVRGGDPTFLHFEVRQGVESVDPIPYLQ